MLTDTPRDIDMHLGPNKKLNIIKESMYLDLTTLSIPLSRQRKFKKTDLNKLNNNVEIKQDVSLDHATHVKLPINMMQPPIHKVVNYTVTSVAKAEKKNINRGMSPKRHDSDENFTSTFESTLDHTNKGIKYSNIRNGINRFGDPTKIFGNFTQSTPNVYQNVYYQHNNNGNYQKNRQKQTTRNGAPDMMMRRAHGLVERFKSRSIVMKIDPSPAALLTGSPWDSLNQAIWDVFSSKAQKEKTYELKVNLWKHIFLFMRKCLSSYGLFIVGSTMSGFGLDSSDIDMCLLTKPCTTDPRLDALQHLSTLRQLFVKYGIALESELILAKVPILKFREKETGFEIDLNCNNSVGIRNTHLLYSYSKLDWRVRPLVVIVKLWAQSNNINDAKNMTVSSYSFALMVIHYLQCGVSPPVLPCLHGLLPDKFNSDSENHTMDVQEEISAIKDFRSANTNCLGELLLGFLHYYSYFNYNQYAISVRAGCRLPIDECRFMKAPKNDPNQWKYMCIEEPFDFTNTARSVLDIDKFKFIKDVIAGSYKELDRTKLLSSILPVNLHHYR